MHTLRTTLSLVIILLLTGAFAHSGEALRTTEARVGPYPIRIHYYSEPRGGNTLDFSIEPLQDVPGDLSYDITAVPGTTTNATSVKATLEPSPDHPNGVDGSVFIPVSGLWLLDISIGGPYGATDGYAPILAGAPPAIPFWAGWIIGLLPLGSLVFFWSVRASQHMRDTHTRNTTSARASLT